LHRNSRTLKFTDADTNNHKPSTPSTPYHNQTLLISGKYRLPHFLRYFALLSQSLDQTCTQKASPTFWWALEDGHVKLSQLPHILSCVNAAHHALLKLNLLLAWWYAYGTQFNLYKDPLPMQADTFHCPSHPAAKTIGVEEDTQPNCCLAYRQTALEEYWSTLRLVHTAHGRCHWILLAHHFNQDKTKTHTNTQKFRTSLTKIIAKVIYKVSVMANSTLKKRITWGELGTGSRIFELLVPLPVKFTTLYRCQNFTNAYH